MSAMSQHIQEHIEWVWVNQNGPNTEMVIFNCTQNGRKNFFMQCCHLLLNSKMRLLCAKQHPLPSCFMRYVDGFIFLIWHFGENGQLFDETVFSKLCLLTQQCV